MIVIHRKKSKSSVGYRSSAVNNSYPNEEDEKVELKEMQSLNGEVTSELEPIKTPDLIPSKQLSLMYTSS